VCKQGLLVDLANIVVVVDFPPPTSLQSLRATSIHTWYYMKFIRGDAQITDSLEKLLKKEVKFQWNKECQQSWDNFKYKLVTTQGIVKKVVEENANKLKTHITADTAEGILQQETQVKEKFMVARETFQKLIATWKKA
jgi:hypothetical protein